MSLFSSLIGGGASLLGGLFQNSSAKKAASRQMRFQEQMFNTRYQRTMADMKAAGLNPILAYKQGGGSAPGGSTYSPVNVGAAAVSGGATATNTALAAARNTEELKNIAADTTLKNDQGNAARANAAAAVAQAANTSAQTAIAREQLITAKGVSTRAKQDAKFYSSEQGEWARWLDNWGRSLNPFATTAKNAGGVTNVGTVRKYRRK